MDEEGEGERVLEIARDYLPSADFSIDSSSDDEERESRDGGMVSAVPVFIRAPPGREEGTEGVAPVGVTCGSSSKDERTMIVEDLEDEEREEGEKEWEAFRADFQKAFESSEEVVKNATLSGQIQMIKEAIMVNSVAMETNDLPADTTKKTHIGPNTRVVLPGKSHKVLQSNNFDKISENDLDKVLEAIKEDSREGSMSPVQSNPPPFKWDPLLSPEVADHQLMIQLQSSCDKQQTETKRTKSLITSASLMTKNTENKSLHMSETDTIHLDLRPQSIHFSNDKDIRISESAKRLMLSKGLLTKSNSDDSEDLNDGHDWLQERQLLKNLSQDVDHPLLPSSSISRDVESKERTKEPTNESSPHLTNKSHTVKEQPCINNSRSCSDSLSSDDVFDVVRNDPDKEESSPGEPPSIAPDKKNQDNVKSKKKKRSGRGRKRSGSGSSSDNETKHKNKNDKNKSSTKHKQKKERNRSDSLSQQSSDDDNNVKGEAIAGVVPISRSYSEGDCDNLMIDVERRKNFLLRTIESRKPPSLFDTPNTPPIFHQDVSFTPVLSHSHPFIPSCALLLLPLTDNGMVDMDTVDLPSNDLDNDATQFLHLVLLTWLISMCHDHHQASLWRPFVVTGLQQTIIDGMAYIATAIGNTDQNSDGHHQIVDVLKSSKLERITDSLLSTINVKPSEKILNDLHSVANIHLSSLFTIQTDISPLSTPLSFYSQCFYSSQSLPANNSFKSSSVLQTTVCTVHQSHLHHTRLIFDLFYAAINEGLDITGLRIVYCNNKLNSFSSSAFLTSEEQHVVLAIAFRGPNAITSMVDIVGPEDHSIARVTDPESLSARYGQSKQVAELPPIVGTVHNEYWAGMELARWFGGRACLKTGSVLGISDPITKFERRKRQRVRFSESESEGAIPPLPDDIAYPPLICNRPVLLVYPYSKILLVASPHVNPFCYTSLLRSVARMGYDIMGIKRLRLNTKRGLSLNISASDILHFTPSSAPLSPVLGAKVEPPDPSQSSFPPLPSLLLVLGRENAPLYTTALTNAICNGLRQLSMQHQDALDTSLIDSPNALIHIVEYSEDCLKNIGSFTFTPTNTNGTKPSKVLMEEEGFKEEISFMAVIGHQSLEKSLNTLDVIVKTPSSQGESETGCFELLGIKLVDELSRYQAKQLCGCTSHYSQGSPAFTGMVDSLCDKPAMLFVLRGINCNHSISKLISESSSHQRVVLSEFQFDLKSNNVLCSADLDKSFHLTSLFFIDKELFSHPSQWSFSIHAPSTWLNDCSILSSLTSDPIPLLSIFSVDMSHMGLLVKILQKLYHVGFKVVGMRLIEHEIESEDLEDSPQVNDNEYAVVVCVERYNAVWYLIHELKLFSSNSPSYAKALYYSPSFISAVNDVQHYFPLGVHSSSTALLKYYQIQPAPNDSFGSRVESPVPSHLSPPPSPLSEDAYLIIPPSHLMSLSSSIPSYVTALDVLSKSGFSIIDILMIELSKETAQDICQAIDTTTTEFTELTRGPSLVVGIRRDNAASCFHSIITSSFLHCGIRDDPAAISKLFQNVLVTSSSQQTAVVRKIVKFEDCSNWF